jgi:hypothetical protein
MHNKRRVWPRAQERCNAEAPLHAAATFVARAYAAHLE